MILFCFDCGYVNPLSAEASAALCETIDTLAECGVKFILLCPCGCVLHDMVTEMPSLSEVPARVDEDEAQADKPC